MDSTGTTQAPNWLERMHQYLNWKLIGPEVSNPYKKMSDKVLQELSSEREVLRRNVTVRGMMDGEEILTITSLSAFTIKTENPELRKLSAAEIKRYLQQSGVLSKLEHDLDEVQAHLALELKKRQRS